jgi:hypothetical protein
VFPDFIQSFYKYVEPTTVTPYTFSVRERMLRQVVVTLIRHIIPQRQDSPQGYGHITDEQFNIIKELICGRVLDPNCQQQCREEIDGIIEKLKTTTYVSYDVSKSSQNDAPIFCDPLLAANLGPLDFPAPAMQALRNVDAQVPVCTQSFPNN